ncbi:MAG: glycosyltransferase [Saprospiraceae bacterium]|nr:glycosyltransferase [Saprospiraceae bacterium]
MTKKKILFVIPTLQSGGSERVFTTIAHQIDPSVFDITFMVLDGRDAFFSIHSPHIKFMDLQTPKVTKAFWAIRAWIKKEQPNIVFSTLSHLNIILAMGRFFLAAKNARFIARESSVMSLNNQYQNPTWLFNFLTRQFYNNFDTIICQSRDMHDDFVHHFDISEQKLSIINNPIDAVEIEKKINVALSSRTGDAPQQTPFFRFVTVGRLTKSKGIDRLLRVLHRLDAAFVFDIVGDGQEMDNLKALADNLGIKEKVRFHGALDNPFPLVAQADVFLFGSHHEGFPNVLIEAGACGTPVVSFDCKGGINEIIEQGENGFMVAHNDFFAFEKALRVSLEVPFDRQKIKQRTQERFGMVQIIKKYENIFLG